VHDGAVTLRGPVEVLSQRERAERIALGVPGVASVENRLRVWLTVSANDVANRVTDAIGRDAIMGGDSITVRVTGTDVVLSGAVTSMGTGETYTEPHYLRQAQRYLGHAVRCLRASGRPVTVVTLADAMVPDKLEWFGRALPDEQAKRVHDYVDSLSAEQRRGLAGTRDRLAILAESDVVNFLYRREPTRHNIDLLAAVRRRDVVLFRLDADRRPLLAGMLAAAIVQDLLTIAAELLTAPVPTLVLVDEFSAVAPAGVVRLFGRGRSAGLSLLLGTQELADLRPPDNPPLADQVLGNVTTLIAHRQVVPQSAETLAGVMGTRGAWTHTEHRDLPRRRRARGRRASSSSIPTRSSACRPATPPSPVPATTNPASSA
jgi:hypothetical protein